MRYTQIPSDTFKSLQLNAGILLSDFKPETGSFTESDMLGATTGGNSFTATPTFTDYGEDIDSCPANMKELKKLTSWEAKLSGTFVTISPGTAKRLTAAADVTTGDKAGFVAIHLLNSLSTAGFQLQSNDDGKGQFAFEFTGHYSLDAQDVPPFEVYVAAGTAAATASEEA